MGRAQAYEPAGLAYTPTLKKHNPWRWRPEGPISYNPAGSLGGAVSSHSGVWGKAPADFYSGAFLASQASGDNDYKDFLSQNINSFFPVKYNMSMLHKHNIV